MDELNDLIDNKKSLSTEEWKNFKNQEKQSLYEMVESSLTDIKDNQQNFEKYLDIKSKFSNYSVNNTLLIYAQKPDATKIKPFDEWKKYGASVLNGEKGIMILEPSEKFTREDGTEGVYFNVKKVFDISQTSYQLKPKTNFYSNEVLLKGFLYNCSIKPMEEMKENALWNDKEKILYIKKGLDAKELFYSVLKELSKKDLNKKDKLIDFKSDCIAYMICKRYNININNLCNTKIPDNLKNMDNQEFKNELINMNNCMDEINSKINEYFEKLSNKNKEQER